MNLKNPENLNDIPKEYYENSIHKGSVILEDKEELMHYRSIIALFWGYNLYCFNDYNLTYMNYLKLTKEHSKLWNIDINKKIKLLKESSFINYIFLYQTVEHDVGLFKISKYDSEGRALIEPHDVKMNLWTKFKGVFNQIARDWSKLGKIERLECYDVIIDKIKELYPIKKDIEVLVPGSGMGRLPFEIAKNGYNCEGNEFDYFQLLISNYLINNSEKKNLYNICPFIHNSNNKINFQEQIIKVSIPDCNIKNKIPKGVNLGVCSGEFLSIYNTKEKKNFYNVIVTCFFIDTAHNVLEYLEVIKHCLKNGGYWINFGPLLYHYSNLNNEMSIDLSWDEIKNFSEKIGFKFLSIENKEVGYCNFGETLNIKKYNCIFSVSQINK